MSATPPWSDGALIRSSYSGTLAGSGLWISDNTAPRTDRGGSLSHELKTHSVPIPALIYVVEGEGEFELGSETVPVKSGFFIRMQALLPHAVRAKTPFRMLLVQVKDAACQQ